MLRNLHFFDGIDTAELEAFSRAVAGAESCDVITLDFCNGGGSVFHGIAMCDMMNAARANGVKFISNVWGYAASAACLVALSADEVYMSENAAIMYHSAWSPFGGDNPAISVANAAQQKLLAGRISKISEKDFDGDDHWITADAASELGIIDGFIGSKNGADSENVRLAAQYIFGGLNMKKTEKLNAEVEAVKAEAPCMENEEEKKDEETKALDDDVMTVDVLEQMAQRLEEIEKRLAVLEGEGKKADDEGASDGAESGDQIAARLNSLYARLSGGKADEKPVVATTGKVSKKAKMEASFERSKKLDLKSFM